MKTLTGKKLEALKKISSKPYSVMELAIEMQIERTNLSSILTYLNGIGMLSVEQSKDDARKRFYSITEQGKEALGVQMNTNNSPALRAYFESEGV